MDTRNILKKLELDEKEISLYLAGLELGDMPLATIAKKAGVNRSSAYFIAKRLGAKGLLGSYEMRGILRYSAVSPQILLSKTAALAEEMKKTAEALKMIVPELEAVKNKELGKPKISYYEGKEGYFTVLEDALSVPNIIIRNIGSAVFDVVDVKYNLEYFIPQRLKKHIVIKTLAFQSEMEEHFEKRKHLQEFREARYLPEKFRYSGFMVIFRNKVAILSSKKELAVVLIESEDIATAEKQKFEMLWESSLIRS